MFQNNINRGSSERSKLVDDSFDLITTWVSSCLRVSNVNLLISIIADRKKCFEKLAAVTKESFEAWRGQSDYWRIRWSQKRHKMWLLIAIMAQNLIFRSNFARSRQNSHKQVSSANCFIFNIFLNSIKKSFYCRGKNESRHMFSFLSEIFRWTSQVVWHSVVSWRAGGLKEKWDQCGEEKKQKAVWPQSTCFLIFLETHSYSKNCKVVGKIDLSARKV